MPYIIHFVKGDVIKTAYDAAGRKWKKEVIDEGIGRETHTMHYCNGVEYKSTEGGSIIYHAEGRAVRNVKAEEYRYEYSLRDHLGNTRVTFSDINGDGYVSSDEVLQENHYYPFGMNTEGKWLTPGYPLTTNKYQYNGKELNNDFGLNWSDYGARWYDGAVGRFLGVDPLAEKYASISPYVYVANNPIRLIDPDGRAIIVGDQEWEPGAEYEGEDDFGKQVFAFLETLYENIEAGDVSKKGKRIGNVIMDFVGENAVGDVEIVNSEGHHDITSDDGTMISFNPNEGIYVTSQKGSKEGELTPATLLAHEFAHAWLAQASPRRNAAYEAWDAQPERRGEDRDKEHTQFVLPIERRFSEAQKGGGGMRTRSNRMYNSKSDWSNRNASGVNNYGDYWIKY